MDQTHECIIRRKETLINEWKNSFEYKNLCRETSCYVTSLIRIGEEYMTLYTDKQESVFARTEFASSSELHRGFYCPSLVYDVIVGNVRRGKLLKRISQKSKSFFIYNFNQENRLILCKRFYNGQKANVERLFYDKNHVYGITLDSNGKLQCVSSETYINNKIVCYEYVLVSLSDGVNQCLRMWREDYEYEFGRLKVCYRHEFYPQQTLYIKNRFTFDWGENCMTGYLSEEITGDTDEVVLSGSYHRIKPQDT